MKYKDVNGCGCGSGLLKYFKPPYAHYFKSCCNAHDAAYDAGGTENDRAYADRWLYRHMVKLANEYEDSPEKITWLVFVAFLYYTCVRIFGRKYFNYKK